MGSASGEDPNRVTVKKASGNVKVVRGGRIDTAVAMGEPNGLIDREGLNKEEIAKRRSVIDRGSESYLALHVDGGLVSVLSRRDMDAA